MMSHRDPRRSLSSVPAAGAGLTGADPAPGAGAAGDLDHSTRFAWQTAMEWSAIAAAAVLWAFIARRLADAGGFTGPLIGFTALGVAAGYLAGDFMSGVVHWFCDTFFEEDTPLIGPVVIHPFREHHRDPLAMTRHGFAEIAGNSCLVLMPLLAIVAALPRPAPGGVLGISLYGFLLSFTVVAVATNQLHKWAHTAAPPPLIARLQAVGAILRPRRHAVHHRTQAEAYCVATGWLNAPLDRLAFFPRAERVLVALGLPMSVTAPRWRPPLETDA